MVTGLNPHRLKPNVWIKERGGGYDYIKTHNDDVLVISAEPNYRFNKLKEIYMIDQFGAPKVHL